MAENAAASKQWNEFLERLRSVLGPEPEADDALLLAEASLAAADLPTARRELERLVATPQPRIEALSLLAEVYRAGGDFESALACLRRVFELAPERLDLEKWTEAVAETGTPELLEELFRRGLASGSGELSLVERAFDRQLRRGRLDLAQAVLDAGLRVRPDAWPLWVRAARMHLDSGEVEAARTTLEKLLAIHDPEAWALVLRQAEAAEPPSLRETTTARRKAGPWVASGHVVKLARGDAASSLERSSRRALGIHETRLRFDGELELDLDGQSVLLRG